MEASSSSLAVRIDGGNLRAGFGKPGRTGPTPISQLAETGERLGCPQVFSGFLSAGFPSRSTLRDNTTLLTQNNEEVTVVQELLRHANSRITLDLYAQAGMPNKRLAQSKLVRMVLTIGRNSGLTGP